MKKTLAMLLLMALFFSGVLAVAEQKWISDDNKAFFADLLTDLMRAYETPSKDDDTRIDTDLAQIRLVSESDWEIASAIAEHWRDVYLDDDYPLFIYKEGEQLASALKETSLRDSERHAFVLLGYELKNGDAARAGGTVRCRRRRGTILSKCDYRLFRRCDRRQQSEAAYGSWDDAGLSDSQVRHRRRAHTH